MNADDPKFTAYAFDELDPAERAAVEAELSAHPELAEELAELRRFAAQLRGELQAEEGAPLLPAQRAVVLGQEARTVAGPRSWWRSPWVQSAAAACLIVGLIAAHFARMEMKGPQTASTKMAGHEMKLAMEPDAAAPQPGTELSYEAGKPLVDAKPAGVQSNLHERLDLGKSVLTDPASKGLAMSGPQGSQPVVDLSEERKRAALELAASLPSTAPLDNGLVQGVGSLQAPDSSKMSTMDPGAPAKGKGESASAARKPAIRQLYAAISTERLGRAPTTWEKPTGAARKNPDPADSYSYRAAGARAKMRVDIHGDGFDDAAGAPGQVPEPDAAGNTETYDAITDNPFYTVKDQPLSTFSVDVDTASYANVRRFLNANERPPKGAVRIEELINYFRYDYPQPDGADPFSCTLEAAMCPWETQHRLVRIGLKGRELKRESRPAANLVFLIDVSGSMQPENRLPLVKQSLGLLVDQLTAEDTVAIAVYAGNSGCVLEPTHDRDKMRAALEHLEAGGSTNGAAGIQLAYDLAQRSFKKDGTNRVILCTDGDFNVGITSQSELVSMIQGKAKTGIFLSVFGVGMGNLKDATLEKLADKGNGNYGYIDSLAEGRKVFVEQVAGTLFTIAKDVKAQVEFNPAQVAAYRLVGYENRLLAKEDFNDDTKDAGEIGAGHTVTALFEIVPTGKEVPGAPAVDDLKYQKAAKPSLAQAAGEGSNKEMLTVKLRYKQPDGDVSKKLEFSLTDNGATWEKSSRDFRWAASVASFGLLLRDSPHKGSANWNMTLELATEGKGDDRDGYRSEFVGLVEKAKALCR